MYLKSKKSNYVQNKKKETKREGQRHSLVERTSETELSRLFGLKEGKKGNVFLLVTSFRKNTNSSFRNH